MAFVKEVAGYWRERKEHRENFVRTTSREGQLAAWGKRNLIPKLTTALQEIIKTDTDVKLAMPQLAAGLVAAEEASVAQEYTEALAAHSKPQRARVGDGELLAIVHTETPRLDILVAQGVIKYGYTKFFQKNSHALFDICRHAQEVDLTERFCAGCGE